MNVLLSRGDREFRAEVVPAGEGYRVTLEGRSRQVEGTFGPMMRVRIDGRPVEAAVRRQGLDVVVKIHGRDWVFRRRDPRGPALARRRVESDRTRGELHAPMPGLVVEVLAVVGDRVEAGQPLVVVEAMKMQNALAAPVKGRVTAVPVAAGAAVESGELLVAIAPEGA